MKGLKWVGVLMVLIPSLLWGWGNDVIVDTLRSSAGQYPVAYDIVWPTDTNMIVAVAYNVNNADGYINLYQSRDNGQNWTLRFPIYWTGHKVKDVRLAYDNENLFILWLGADGYLYYLVYDVELTAYLGGATVVIPPDSAIAGFIETITRGSDKYIYLIANTRNASYDSLKVFRSINYAAFQRVYTTFWGNSTFYRTYRDLDLRLKGDTIIMYATYARTDRSTNDNDVYCYVFKDTSNIFYFSYLLSIASESSIDETNPSLSVGPGGYGIAIYQVGNDLKYAFSTDYFTTFTTYDFPYNTADSTEWAPYTKWWWVPPYLRGFNTVFLRGYNVYFTESSCSGTSMIWYDPVLVSDQRPSSFHIGNLGNYNYYPRLSNRSGLAIPAIIWPYDFWHFVPPYLFLYDSTYILVDNMNAVGVNEVSTLPNILSFTVTAPSRDKIMLQFKDPTNENTNGNLISVDGRVLKNFEIPAGSREYEIKAAGLSSGVYFIQITGKTARGTKKIIITQ